MSEEDLRRTIGERVNALLALNRASQAHLADVTGKSRASVNRWMKGRMTPPVSWLMKVADHYDVSLDWIVGRDEAADSIHEAVRFYRTLREALREADR